MWYFTWILGVTAALAIAVINVMWFEFQNEFETRGAALPGTGEAIEGFQGGGGAALSQPVNSPPAARG